LVSKNNPGTNISLDSGIHVESLKLQFENVFVDRTKIETNA